MLPSIITRRTTPNLWDRATDFDRLFDFAFGAAPSLSAWSPAVDIRETGDEFIVTAEVPGLTKDDLELSVENGVLSISGEKKEEYEEGGNGTGRHLVERRYGRFQRNFSLPSSVNTDRVEASFKDGVLTVTLPKAEVAKPKRIKIGS